MTKVQTPRIAFIKARWHADIVDCAHQGFESEIVRQIPAAEVDAFEVPGAFEMPLLAKKLALSSNFDAVVAAAFVVDGGIYRHDFVADAVVQGLMQVQLETMVPVFSVSLTPHNYQPVAEMTEFFREHFLRKGAEAAHAVEQVLRHDIGAAQADMRKSA